jgi:hypothetical protein
MSSPQVVYMIIIVIAAFMAGVAAGMLGTR